MTRDALQEAVREIESAGDSIIQPRKVSDAGLWETDLETGLTEIDEALERMYGFEPGTWEGDYDDWAELVHPNDLPRVQEAWDAAIENGGPYQIVYRIIRQDGVVRWIDSRARLVTDEDGQPVAMRGLNTDITESQERIQALQVLDRVLRHNLRNNMTVIRGRADLIAEMGSEEVIEHVDEIRQQADELLEKAEKQRTIGDLLSTDFGVEQVDLVPLIDEIIASIREEHPQVEIHSDYPGQAIISAVDAVDTAIRELIENAVIHNDRDQPVVEVAVEKEHESVVIRIVDNGPGIPEVEQEIVTGQQEISPLQHASGLGLWLVSWVMERSGGMIQFDEGQPRGTIAQIRF